MAEDMLPKPSVGRIVHYNYVGTCYAAIITSVRQSNDSVSLTVYPPLAHSFNVDNAPHGANSDEGTWHWPERV